KSRKRNIPARDDADYFLSAQAVSYLYCPGQRSGAGAFSNLPSISREQTNCVVDLFVADEDEIVWAVPQNSIREFKRDARGQALVLRFHRGESIQVTITVCVPKRGSSFRLNRDHPSLWSYLIRHDAIPRGTAAATGGRDNHVNLG